MGTNLEDKKGYTYLITCLINSKKYVGASRRIVGERWNEYISSYNRGYFTIEQPNNEEDTLLSDMLKYGIEKFTFQIIEITTLKELFKREEYWITYYDTVNTGYNSIYNYRESADVELLLKNGKENRYRKGGIPHNAISVQAISDDSVIEFTSYNEAGRYLIKNRITDDEIYNVSYKINQATKKNKEVYGFKWFKEGTTDINYKGKEYKTEKYLIGEIYSNTKGYKFEIKEELKGSKRKVKFVDTGYETIAGLKEVANGSIKDWEAPYVCGIGIVGKELQNPQKHYLYDKWRDMLRRCYDENRKNDNYTTCERWFRLKNYIEDIELLDIKCELQNKNSGLRIKLKEGKTEYNIDNINFVHKKDSITRRDEKGRIISLGGKENE